jgi:hypothetical protein
MKNKIWLPLFGSLAAAGISLFWYQIFGFKYSVATELLAGPTIWLVMFFGA